MKIFSRFRSTSKAVVLIAMYIDAYHSHAHPIIGRDGNVVGWWKP